MNKKVTSISVFALSMLITGAIDSLRNLPTTALFGTSIIFFFVIAAICFLLPTSLISAELSAKYPDKGGIYDWVKMAFGPGVGFLAVWLQWINTVVWYPTILSFIAGLIAYLINPSLVHNKYFLVSVILVVFWLSTIFNLKGIKSSAKYAMICGFFGMALPMFLVCVLGLEWVISGKPIAIDLTVKSLIPNFSSGNNWIALTAIITSFLGMELATVHVKNISNANKVFPKALMFSVIFVFVTMILGSLSIAFVLPKDKISLVDGIMQAFSFFFNQAGIGWITPVIALLIIIGSIGGLTNWIISPAKGLLFAAQDGFLPKVFHKSNKNDVPVVLLFVQAAIVSLVCLVFLFMPSVNGAYWLLTDLSTQLYVFMYVIMFFAAIALSLKNKNKNIKNKNICFKIPGGNYGTILTCSLGLIGCCVALIVGFIPPGNIDVGTVFHFEMMFGVGILVMCLPVWIFKILREK